MMSQAVKTDDRKSPAPQKKAYVSPRLVTHGNVAQMTNSHKPHHHGDGPESELS